MANVVFLKGDGLIKEARAAAAGILPGHRLDLTDNSGVTEVGVGGAAGATDAGRTAFAVENSAIGGQISTVYADNDQVKYVYGEKGDEVQARAATTLTWVKGAPLYAAAAGQVTDVPGVGVQAIGYALSNVTTSAADDLVPMEVA